MNKDDQQAYDIVRKLFKNDYGEPFEMTAGQIKLFRAIYEKQHPRNQYECYTQYGKSDVVSMATLLRATTFAEKWIILGGTKDKAGIIMNKLIKHIFDNDYTLGKFQVDKNETLENIRRFKSKDHVSFRIDDTGAMGEVIILSGDTKKQTQDAGDILIGHGGQNLIEDDAALIPDLIHGKAMRMLGGHKENFLLKITNTFGRNHAYKSSAIKQYDDKQLNPDGLPRPGEYISDAGYNIIKITYLQGIEEGRMDQEYADEMKGLLDDVMFGVLYRCEYPSSDMVEEGDWIPLITDEQIEEAQKRTVMADGTKRLGVDVAEGGNFNAFVIRQDNYAKLLEKTLEKDLMKTAEHVAKVKQEQFVNSQDTFIDATGVGSGVASRVNQLGAQVNAIVVGEKSHAKTEKEKILDPVEYFNIRAEINWKAKRWIELGGALEPSVDWKQATKMRYKTDGGKTLKIMPKEMMRARGLIAPTESPDVWEAFTLTFAPKKVVASQGTWKQPSQPAVLPYYPDLGM